MKKNIQKLKTKTRKTLMVNRFIYTPLIVLSIIGSSCTSTKESKMYGKRRGTFRSLVSSLFIASNFGKADEIDFLKDNILSNPNIVNYKKIHCSGDIDYDAILTKLNVENELFGDDCEIRKRLNLLGDSNIYDICFIDENQLQHYIWYDHIFNENYARIDTKINNSSIYVHMSRFPLIQTDVDLCMKLDFRNEISDLDEQKINTLNIKSIENTGIIDHIKSLYYRINNLENVINQTLEQIKNLENVIKIQDDKHCKDQNYNSNTNNIQSQLIETKTNVDRSSLEESSSCKRLMRWTNTNDCDSAEAIFWLAIAAIIVGLAYLTIGICYCLRLVFGPSYVDVNKQTTLIDSKSRINDKSNQKSDTSTEVNHDVKKESIFDNKIVKIDNEEFELIDSNFDSDMDISDSDN